jgi:hypothetical protein
VRDKVARAQQGLPQRGDVAAAADRATTNPPEVAPVFVRTPRTSPGPRRYPVPGVTSILECPVHQLVVALDNQGRITSSCPGCRREAEAAIERWAA